MEEVQKVEVGHRWDLLEDTHLISKVGGYQISYNENGIFICGSGAFNLTASAINPVSIYPATKEFIEIHHSDPGSIGDIFNIENKVYFILTYGDRAYIFKRLDEAQHMASLMLKYKADALEELINPGSINQEADEVYLEDPEQTIVDHIFGRTPTPDF